MRPAIRILVLGHYDAFRRDHMGAAQRVLRLPTRRRAACQLGVGPRRVVDGFPRRWVVRRTRHDPGMAIQRRRGARRPSLVPPAILAELESGAESANHMEQIALDMGNLLSRQLPALRHRADELRVGGLVTRMRVGGQILFEELGIDVLLAKAGRWGSDTQRGWAAMAVGHAPDLDFEHRVALLLPFADDLHFAVREWAWLALRPHVAEGDVISVVTALEPLTHEPSDRLRRFASEATRPRGVWSAHVPGLKTDPGLALPLLTPLRADRARYVQDSVGNWLNDAGKTRPDWVHELCSDWSRDGDPSTARICRRALRSLQNS